MTSQNESNPVLQMLKQKKMDIERISKKYGISDIKVFGSTVQNKMTNNSDVDLLIHVNKDSGLSLFDLAKLQDELEGLIKHPVDLVLEDTLHPIIAHQIQEEAQPL